MKFKYQHLDEVAFYRAFNTLLVECTSLIVQSDERSFDTRMNTLLEKIGVFAGVDRSYFFEIDQPGQTSSNTHEWCNTGVESQMEYLQNIPFEAAPKWFANMMQGKEVYIDDLAKLDASWAAEKEILEPQGIQSLLSIPVRESDFVYGFIGFDAVTYKIQWPEDTRLLLQILADNIGSVIRRNKQNRELRMLNEELEMKVASKSEEYLKLMKIYNEQERLVAIGEVTAGIAHDLNTPIGTVIIGAQSLTKHLEELLASKFSSLTADEMQMAYALSRNITPEKYVSGLQQQKETEEVKRILGELPEQKEQNSGLLAGQLVRCRITDSKQIQELATVPHILRVLEVVEQLQTLYALADTIIHSAESCVRVVQNLRQYIKDPTISVSSRVNLYSSITSALNIFTSTLKQRIHIHTEISPDVYVSGNEIKLFQLWSNIIKNAIEAMHDTPDPVLNIRVENKSGYAVISFENNGPAIPADSLQQLFQRFYSTKTNQGGSGLGLTIIQNVVKEHGGEIDIKSTDGSTQYIITLSG